MPIRLSDDSPICGPNFMQVTYSAYMQLAAMTQGEDQAQHLRDADRLAERMMEYDMSPWVGDPAPVFAEGKAIARAAQKQLPKGHVRALLMRQAYLYLLCALNLSK